MRKWPELAGTAEEVAKRLLGSVLLRRIGGAEIAVKIVETEAYDQIDAASHSYRGQTPRTSVMFGQAGYAYVYFTYGLHYCMNVVCGPVGYGSAVLLRAVEPINGIDLISAARGGAKTEYQLTNGPAKLCQALQIDKTFNGHDLRTWPLKLQIRPPLKSQAIASATRVGIKRDTHRLWRFYVKDNPFVSKN